MELVMLHAIAHGGCQPERKDMTGPIAEEIERKLVDAFAPTHLAVINDSASHSGHLGDDGTGDRTSPWKSRAPPLPGFRASSASGWSTRRWAICRASGFTPWPFAPAPRRMSEQAKAEAEAIAEAGKPAPKAETDGVPAPASLLRNHEGGHAPVSYLELFFDLVYVFAVTQLSHHVLHHMDPAGLAEALVLFLAVWWAWMFTAWAANWTNPERGPVRIMLLFAMLASLGMAVAMPRALRRADVAMRCCSRPVMWRYRSGAAALSPGPWPKASAAAGGAAARAT
jgi:hypothetical protein